MNTVVKVQLVVNGQNFPPFLSIASPLDHSTTPYIRSSGGNAARGCGKVVVINQRCVAHEIT